MYSFTGRVRYSETDSDERLTLAALTDYFQDCSTFQSEELGLGVKYLQRVHQAWVVSAWQIVVGELPMLCDEIRVCTCPYAFKGFLGYRNFWMERPDGQRLAWANAVWTLLDMETMLPVRASEEMHEKYVLEPKLDMEYAPRKILIPENGVAQDSFIVQRQHLDSNHHVNNAQYVKMAVQYLPEDYQTGQLRVEYKSQAHLNDVICPMTAVNGNVRTVWLNSPEGMTYAVLEFTQE